MSVELCINGEQFRSNRDNMTPLVDVLRDEFSLTGAKVVCREGVCGACTVLLDDQPVASCLVPIGVIEGRKVRTVESLAAQDRLSPVQQIMADHDVVQCGMCFPGIVMVLTSLFKKHPRAGRDEIKAALVGNICRCTGYERLVSAAAELASRG